MMGLVTVYEDKTIWCNENSCLPYDCLITFWFAVWWMSDYYFDNFLIIFRWLSNDFPLTFWWFSVYFLMIFRWISYDFLVAFLWHSDEYLIAIWWLSDDFLLISVDYWWLFDDLSWPHNEFLITILNCIPIQSAVEWHDNFAAVLWNSCFIKWP